MPETIEVPIIDSSEEVGDDAVTVETGDTTVIVEAPPAVEAPAETAEEVEELAEEVEELSEQIEEVQETAEITLAVVLSAIEELPARIASALAPVIDEPVETPVVVPVETQEEITESDPEPGGVHWWDRPMFGGNK